MSEIDKMLAQFQAEGRYDSTGSFSLDPEKQRQKLASHLLPEKPAYVLKLVQWAVACGARRIEVEVSRNLVRLAHTGESLEAEDILNWLEHLDSPDLRKAHLANALNATTVLPASRVTVSKRQPGKCYDVNFGRKGDSIRHFVSETLNTDAVSFVEVERPRPTLGSRLALQQFAFDVGRFPLGSAISNVTRWSELVLVRECCRFCPVPLRVNGQYANQPFFGFQCAHDDINGLNCVDPRIVDGGYPDYEVWYVPIESKALRLQLPSVHQGTIRSTWVNARGVDEDQLSRGAPNDVVVEGKTIKTSNRLRRFQSDAPLRIFGGMPLAGRAMVIRQPKFLLAGQARATYVFDGVNIHSEQASVLPRGCYGVVCGHDLDTDLTGMAPKKSAHRFAALSEIAGKVRR